MDPLEIERELASYYDAEGDLRVGRPVSGSRLDARDRFVAETVGAVLEIGSGPGRDAVAFIDAGLRYVAIDLSVEHARRCRATGASIALATARRLPFRDSSFDAMWSMSALMHVPDSAIQVALAEVARVLRPGGHAAIGVWGGPDVETYSDEDTAAGRPPRLFSRRSADRWTAMLAVIGAVESSEISSVDGDLFYQLVLVRTPR